MLCAFFQRFLIMNQELHEKVIQPHPPMTKGLYGFRYQGQDYITINQMESDIYHLGNFLFNFNKYIIHYKHEVMDKLKQTIQNLILVRVDDQIDRSYLSDFHQQYQFEQENIAHCLYWADFFALVQGNLDMYLDGFKYFCQMKTYLAMSGEMEFSYIINLDDETFEIYYGKNTQKQEDVSIYGRYAALHNEYLSGSYYGVVLYCAIPFQKIADIMSEDVNVSLPTILEWLSLDNQN